MGQYCFARWCLSSSVVIVCHLSSSVTLLVGGPAAGHMASRTANTAQRASMVTSSYGDTLLLLLLLVRCSKEDVTRTMYVGAPSQVQSTLSGDNVDVVSSAGSADKVDSVCEAVKAAVQKVDADRWKNYNDIVVVVVVVVIIHLLLLIGLLLLPVGFWLCTMHIMSKE